MTIKKYLGDWMKVINESILYSTLNSLNKEYQIKQISPDRCNVFRAFFLCPYNELKVIMLGQDPYPQKGIAKGILFGNSIDTEEDKLSPSLKVIKESLMNFDNSYKSIIFDQTLESWAKQGILMINSALTVEVNKIGSHTMLWRPFISSLLKNLSNKDTGIVYLLFGNQAQTFEPYINKKFNFILKENHPAYYARVHKEMPPTIFKEMNNIIEGKYGEKIKLYS